MGRLTTHILDTANGSPAAGVRIDLLSVSADGSMQEIASVTTNDDGRCDGPFLEGDAFVVGVYELRFHVGEYFSGAEGGAGSPAFFDIVPVRFGISAPVIGVCGLNPHAGEAGHLGQEEQDVIIPVMAKLSDEGLVLKGPLPADTAFTQQNLQTLDVVVAMFHDQGLPVIKHAGFGDVVNITLGLPFVRTSVDHGTALDLAGTGKAEVASLSRALDVAIRLSGGHF